MTDPNELLGRHLDGDADAFDGLVEAFQGSLLRFAAGLLHDRDAAQDVVQETFVRLLRSAASVRDEGKLAAWLYRTCRNLVVDHVRKEQSVERLEQEAGADAHGTVPSVDGTAEHSEMLGLVRDRMKKLTPKESTCIVLKLVEGKSYREIAEITGLSTSNVGFQIHNGLKRLAAFVGAARN